MPEHEARCPLSLINGSGSSFPALLTDPWVP